MSEGASQRGLVAVELWRLLVVKSGCSLSRKVGLSVTSAEGVSSFIEELCHHVQELYENIRRLCGLCGNEKPHQVQQVQVQGAAPGSGQCQV